MRWLGKVRENQSARAQKLTKCRKKLELFFADCIQQLKFFFLLASLADYLYFHFQICFTAFVSSQNASD